MQLLSYLQKKKPQLNLIYNLWKKNLNEIMNKNVMQNTIRRQVMF